MLTNKEDRLRAAYIKHNLYVQSIVPKENLLVWNVKDGWKPLCDFLGKPVPDCPIPHDNKTGDSEFIEKMFKESGAGKIAYEHLKYNFSILLLKIGLVTFVGYKQLRYPGWTQSNISLLTNLTTNYLQKLSYSSKV